MSTKHRKQRKPFPWWLVMVSGVLLVLIAWGLAGRGVGGGSDSGNGTPVLAVDRQSIDFGDVRLDTPLTFSIRITNSGDGTLRFLEAPFIEVLEGC
jgi:hypothetical protein